MPDDVFRDETNADPVHAEQALSASPCRATNVTEPARPSLTMPDEMLRSIRELRLLFDEKIKNDLARDRHIERLYAELQEQKEGLTLRILKPMALDLIALYDNLGKWSTDSAFPVCLVDVQSDVADILDRHGFETFLTTEQTFDPHRQRALRTVATNDAAFGSLIAERVRKGFIYRGKIVRPENVAVYLYHKSAKPVVSS